MYCLYNTLQHLLWADLEKNNFFLQDQVFFAKKYIYQKNVNVPQKGLFTKPSQLNSQKCQEINKNALKKCKNARKHIILPDIL